MARTDFSTPRLCLDCDLSEGATATLSLDEANYLLNVLRLTRGARVLTFNGRDGEFAATIGAATASGRRSSRPTSTTCSRR
jgi:16S rRNA (uracil1498-N3)-methyltransferase